MGCGRLIDTGCAVSQIEQKYACSPLSSPEFNTGAGYPQSFGVQVSPVEIKDLLLAHPQKLIQDVTVAGVSGGRALDEQVPRAWVVLSSGRQ